MITRCLCALVALAVGLSPLLEPRLAAETVKWTRLRTANFTLIGDQGDKPLRRVAERMEQFREVFGRVFPNTKQAPPAPIVVHVFGSERAYQPFMPLFNGKRVDVGGYFQEAPGAYYITLNTEAGERAYPTIFHEYVHLLVGSALADVPVWFNEGLAEVLQHLPVVRRTRGVARPGQGRARLRPARALHPAHGAAGGRLSIAALQRRRAPRHLLCRVVGAGALPAARQPGAQGPARDLPATSTADGVAPAAAFRAAFGGSEADLEKELRRYVRQSLYQSTRVRFADKVAIDKDWIVDQPSEADAQAAFADLLLAVRRPEDAAARAEGALKLTPDHARAQAVLARVRAAQGQADAFGDADRGARSRRPAAPTICRPITTPGCSCAARANTPRRSPAHRRDRRSRSSIR